MVLDQQQHFQQQHHQHHFPQDQPQQHGQTGDSKLPGQSVARRKFAKPPVKVACLACRTSRTRCDGQEPCSSCFSKGRDCSYLPSKRGGPRKKKVAVPPPAAGAGGFSQLSEWQPSAAPATTRYDETDGVFSQIDPLSLPGAGLRHLDFASDVNVQGMFEGIFITRDVGHHTPVSPILGTPQAKQPTVRAYGSEHDILNAYYDFIHPYFPIMPPRTSHPGPDQPLNDAGSHPASLSEEPTLVYQPVSPLSCAISAILALVPHPNDPNPMSPSSTVLRRSYAQTYARLATASIETDGELIDSGTKPSQALNYAQPSIDRVPFHPRAPIELESILALLILCIYEYAQRGNLMKMRYRAGQAWVIAMNLSLYALGPENDEFSEAKRRAWWMTYYCVLQGSIVSVTVSPPPTVIINDPRFTTPYPHFASDPEGWSILLQAQQVLVTAGQFTIDLNRCLKSRSNMPWIYEQMKQLDAWASSAIIQANTHNTIPQTGHPDIEEEFVTARSIRAIAKIKLASAQIKTHRFQAFSDIPIFIKKHYDLATANSSIDDPYQLVNNGRDVNPLACQCHSFENHPNHVLGTAYTGSPSESSTSAASDSLHPHYCWLGPGFPFTSQHSAKVCLTAGLMISHVFQSLPYPLQFRHSDHGIPVPRLDPYADPALLDPRTQLPRTMPSFASCAMQCSYALLMIFYKTRVSKDGSSGLEYDHDGHPSAERLADELRHGLERIVGAVSNYSRAFEALDGMREGIEGAIHSAFSQH
ncbi:hypothetical protein BGW36DRAFT_285569 [Talaromyces proteolyticus]|uniref:Zn(2)-C6 fungal-type domain-containing protein n=1 Tax=Talaromyces proteolyticus TaxID=1131652 RepID=A0AAD4Q5X5_9EURO|nr:uncharacterized protein BGW36DRAFT_285569 [Talaromyces proteolyticus]KAH8705086.1 hypothetical protein BGW36DRAFT_285569 [Talaromyces proteolyticus]